METLKAPPAYLHLAQSAAATFARFPFVLSSAIAGSAIGVYLIEVGENIEPTSVELILFRILLTLTLALPLFITITTFSEKSGYGQSLKYAIRGLGAVALIGYYFSLPVDVTQGGYFIIRHLLLNIGLHFLVAFAPFTGQDESNAFWQFNKALFLRLLSAHLYSVVLMVGLSIAIAAADYLFGIDVESIRYPQLWAIGLGVLQTWFFLAGVPENLKALGKLKDYPNGLKAFAQFVLLPLVALYFVILFAYEGKILISMSWPKGWVSQLVLWYSVVGILSLLLLYPLREKSDSRWIQVFSKWFFLALVPLLGMLLLAIYRRVSDYGFTENRYFVAAMAFGLTVVVIYFIFSKAKDIRIIPITLFSLTLIASYGPWSAFSVSLNSQSARLENSLIKNNLLVDGKVVPFSGDSELGLEELKEMSSMVRYLSDSRSVEPFRKWISDSTLNTIDFRSEYFPLDKLSEFLGFEYKDRWSSSESDTWFSFDSQDKGAIQISGYDYYVHFSSSWRGDTVAYELTGDSLFLIRHKDSNYLQMYIGATAADSSSMININFADSLQEAIAKTSGGNPYIPTIADKTIVVQGANFDAKFVVKILNGKHDGENIEISTFNTRVLISVHSVK